LVGDAVRTTWVLAATVTIPLASMLNGPVVNGVTLVLVVVAAMPLNVSFVNAFNAVTTVLFDATVTDGSFTASIGLFTTTVAVAAVSVLGLHSILLMDWLRIVVGDAVRTTWVLAATVYYSVSINAQWSCR
jgi:hypothetical protein